MAQALPHFPWFDLDSDLTSIGSRWEQYIRRFENLLVAVDVTDDARKKALLLHYAGEKVQDVFETFHNHDKSTFTETKKALAEHFQPNAFSVMKYLTFLKLLGTKMKPLTSLLLASGSYRLIVNFLMWNVT